MLVAPLKVFTSIVGTQHFSHESTHRLLAARTKDEVTSHLIIKDLTDATASITRLWYSDCHFNAQGQFHYNRQLEQLIYDFTQGYSSAGVSINAGYAQAQRDMVDTVLDRLKNFNSRQNTLGHNVTTQKIKVEYGFIGFTDDWCYDYGNKNQINNDDAMQMDIRQILQPFEFTTNHDSLESLKSTQRKYPTLLLFRLTNANDCQSDFAWIDIPSLSLLPHPVDCANSYSEFEHLLKSYSDPLFTGRLECKHSMTHILSQYFGGSYQTMVFTHFTEYGKYDAAHDLNILEYTSGLRNIKCVVAQSRPNPILQEQSHNEKLRDELAKIKGMVKRITLSNAELQHENRQLNDRTASHEAQISRLTLTRSVARAAMDRRKVTSEIEIANVKQQMNGLRILLAEATVACRAYECTLTGLENQKNSDELMDAQRKKRQKENESHVKHLEKQISTLKDKINTLEHDSTMHQLQRDKWNSAEKVYTKQLDDMDKQLQQFSKHISSIAHERDGLRGKNASIRTEMEIERQKMEKAYEFEIKALRDESRRQLEQAELDKGRIMALMDNGRARARAKESSTFLERQYLPQHNEQQRSQQSQPPIQHLHETLLNEHPPSAPTHADQRKWQGDYLSQTSYVHVSDDDHEMNGTQLLNKTTMEPRSSSVSKQNQPQMIRPLNIHESTILSPPPVAYTPLASPPPKISEIEPQPFKPIHSPLAFSVSQSPPLSPILPTVPHENSSALPNLGNSHKAAKKTMAPEHQQTSSKSTTSRVSRSNDLFKSLALSDSEDDGDFIRHNDRGTGRQRPVAKDHNLSETNPTQPINIQQQTSPDKETVELKNAMQQDDDFFAPPRNMAHLPRLPKELAKAPMTTKKSSASSSQKKQLSLSTPQDRGTPKAKASRSRAQQPQPQPQESTQESQPPKQQPQLPTPQPQLSEKELPLASQSETQPATQKPTKKRRKLRGTQIDETLMSPVLGGFAAKYFENG